MMDQLGTECPAAALAQALEIAGADDGRAIVHLDALIDSYGGDARLHFLRGSLLAGTKRYDEALTAMRRAVELAPGFAVARFQLGLLELSSGYTADAEATWQPLDALAQDNPLRLFAAGMRHLIRDEFEDTLRLLREGVALNTENPPLNRDMGLVIDEVQAKLADRAAGDEEEPTSLTNLALQQYAAKPTRH